MFWARSTFLAVIGKNAPAFTVASFAMIITRRSLTVPTPVMTPADGAARYNVDPVPLPPGRVAVRQKGTHAMGSCEPGQAGRSSHKQRLFVRWISLFCLTPPRPLRLK